MQNGPAYIYCLHGNSLHLPLTPANVASVRGALFRSRSIAAGFKFPGNFFVAIFSLVFACAFTASADQIIHRHLPSTAMNLKPIGRLPSTNRLDLIIGLPLQNREALTNLLRQLYDPNSPNFHHYLTPAQFTEQFGPAQDDYDSVITFAKANGLTVTGTHSNRTLVDVQGSIADIERVFHVKMQRYQHPAGVADIFCARP